MIAISERQIITRLEQLCKSGVFYTVVKDHLPLDILNNTKHKIDFIFFRFNICMNFEKRIQDFEWFTAGVETLFTNMVQ